MSTYKEQDIENLLAHLREGIASDSVLALADDIRVGAVDLEVACGGVCPHGLREGVLHIGHGIGREGQARHVLEQDAAV